MPTMFRRVPLDIGELDLASIGLLLAFTTIFYGDFIGDIKSSFWLAPLLTILVFFACWLMVRPQKYFLGDLVVYFGAVIILIGVAYLGRLDFTYSSYFFVYLAVALACCFFTYSGLKELRHAKKLRLSSLHKFRRPMILFLCLSCLVCYLYFNNIIWNFGSEEGEVNIKAFQTLLQGVSPYSKTYPMEYAWTKGNVTPYSYFPVTLLYYGVFSAIPASPVSAFPNFSNLKVGTLLVTVLATVLLLKTFKELKNESLGRFLALLYLLVFGFAWGGQDYIHTFTGFFIILTTYLLLKGKNELALACAGLTALTQPIGTLFSIFVIMYSLRRMKPRIFNWKAVAALVPAVAIFSVFFFWDWQNFMNSIFGWWSGSYGNVVGTYFVPTSVANLTYFLSPLSEAIGGSNFFLVKMALMLPLGTYLLAKHTQTITKTLLSAAIIIFTWLFFVNSWISVMYLQEAIVTSLLLLGLLIVSGRVVLTKTGEAADLKREVPM